MADAEVLTVVRVVAVLARDRRAALQDALAGIPLQTLGLEDLWDREPGESPAGVFGGADGVIPALEALEARVYLDEAHAHDVVTVLTELAWRVHVAPARISRRSPTS